MSFYDNAKAIEKKIGDALADEGLVYTLNTKKYPAMLVISQSQSPYAQMEFMSTAEDGVSSKDSALRFIFELDGIKIHTDNRLIITDAFMTKLKGLAKKWHTAYTHAYFADNISQDASKNADEPTQADTETAAFVTEDAENVTAEGDFDTDEIGDDFPIDECAEALVGSLGVPDETGDAFADLLNEAEDSVSEDE